MRLAGRLAAVLLVVGVIVVAAVAWAHGSAAADPGPMIRTGAVFRGGSGHGLSLSNLNDLVRTLVIETCVAAVVVAISFRRRRRRRARRAAA